ncbi:DegT/DnrJ/EryC1/StrS family aminotransferase [Methylorubrum extorquens]
MAELWPGAREEAALAAVVESGWITMGQRLRDFEQAFADLQGRGTHLR